MKTMMMLLCGAMLAIGCDEPKATETPDAAPRASATATTSSAPTATATATTTTTATPADAAATSADAAISPAKSDAATPKK